jgi:hypothetical protein
VLDLLATPRGIAPETVQVSPQFGEAMNLDALEPATASRRSDTSPAGVRWGPGPGPRPQVSPGLQELRH